MIIIVALLSLFILEKLQNFVGTKKCWNFRQKCVTRSLHFYQKLANANKHNVFNMENSTNTTESTFQVFPMVKIHIIEQNLGQVFNLDMAVVCVLSFDTKLPNLKFKTQPQKASRFSPIRYRTPRAPYKWAPGLTHKY